MGCWESANRLKNDNANYQNQNLKTDSMSFQENGFEKLKKFETEYEVIGQLFMNPQKNVKKIVHKASGKVLCMQVLKKDPTNEKAQSHFIRQIDLLKHLDHQNIIKIFDSFNDGMSSYIITEFCNGGELFDKVITNVYLQERYAAQIMEQLFSAVDFCHKKAIVHRDIKPENILFESESHDSLIKLTDFKSAKFMNPEKKMKKKLGGVYYLAPEVIKGSYTEKCDIWSCGVILYIILCGYPPFSGNTDDKIEKNILNGEFSFKGTEWTHVSNEAKEFIKKLLEYDETKRIKAEEALQDPWFKLHKKRTNSNEGASKKTQNSVSAEEIKTIIYHFIQNNQNVKEDNLKLRGIFESFDKDGDYHLPRESIIKSFEAFKTESNEKIGWIESLLDSLQEDSYNYNEILMLIYKKRIVINKENFERTLLSINKNDQFSINFGALVKEFKKEPRENDEWAQIFYGLQQKNKNDEILIKDLKNFIFEILSK